MMPATATGYSPEAARARLEAKSLINLAKEARRITNEARRLWALGRFNTMQIANQLRVSEAFVYNAIHAGDRP